MKTLLKMSAATAATLALPLALAGTAHAGCGGSTYCSSGQYGGAYTGTSTLPPLSSYYGQQSYSTTTGAYGGSGIEYAASTSYTGSYGGGSVEYSAPAIPFTGSTSSVPGLGANESLQATNCPVSVHNPEGARVLGCYNVVKKVAAPVANTTYYRVVRPVVYVRYPVPVPVPYTVYSPCATSVNYSRYGGYGPQGGFGLHSGFKGGCR